MLILAASFLLVCLNAYTKIFVGLALALLLVFIIRQRNSIKDNLETAKKAKSGLLFCLLAALLFSSGIVLNGSVSEAFSSVRQAVASGLMIIVVFLFVFLIFSFALKQFDRQWKKTNAPREHTRIMFALFLCVFGLYFLLYYPGIFTPDNAAQMQQCADLSTLNGHHPVLHTLLLYALVYVLGRGSPVPYIIFQILLSSAIYSYCCHWIAVRIKNNVIYLLSFLFLLLHPYFGLSSVSLCKDYIFGPILLLFVVLLADAAIAGEESLKSKKNLFLLTLSAILVCMLRNNGIAIIALLIVAAVVRIKTFGKKFLGALVVSFALVLAFQFILTPLASIKKGSIVEALGVPLQQIARTVYDNGSYESEREYVTSLLPEETIKEVFSEKSVDPIKFNENFNKEIIENDVPGFLKVWAKLLPKNLLSYCRAYFVLSESVWNPFSNTAMIEPHSDSVNFTKTNFSPVFPGLTEKVELILNFWQFSRYTPGLKMLWNPAAYFIFYLLCCARICLRKGKGYLMPFIPCFSVWMIVALMTPAALVGRYLNCMIVCFPVYISLLAYNEKQIDRG